MTRRCPAAAAMSEGAKNKDDCKLVLLGREDDEVSLWKIGRQLQKLYWSMRNKKEKKRKEKKRERLVEFRPDSWTVTLTLWIGIEVIKEGVVPLAGSSMGALRAQIFRLGSCLVTKKFCNFFQILCHIESLTHA
jgi:hypothetical protein